jgi:Glycosyltransferase family 87
MRKIPYWALGLLYVASGITAGLVSWYLEQSQNLLVFLQSARDLLSNANLYERHTVEWYKYSPSFAIFFVPFLWVPPAVAAAGWGALNFGSAYLGIRGLLTNEQDDKAALLLSLLAIALVTDGDQANLLIAGTMLLSYKALRRHDVMRFGMFTAVGAFIKIFPIVGLGLLATCATRRNIARGLLWFALASVVLAALPFLFMTGEHYLLLLKSWRALVASEAQSVGAIRGWSVVHMLRDLFAIDLQAFPVQLAGTVVLSVPFALALFRRVEDDVRLDLTLSILMYVVLWNHRSEYCTLVISAIAMTVTMIHAGRTRIDVALLVLTMILTGPILSEFNPQVKGPFAFLGAHRMFHWYRLVPLLALWGRLQFSLVRRLRASVPPTPSSGLALDS